MKIILTKDGSVLYPNGINVFIFELSNALIQLGHEVIVISGHEASDMKVTLSQTFDVKRFPKVITLTTLDRSQTTFFSKGYKGKIKELFLWLSSGARLVKKIAPDMLIANGVIPLYSPACRILVCHDLEFNRVRAQKLYDTIFFQTFDIIAATSTELTRAAKSELSIKYRPVLTIPICVDTHKYFSLLEEQREHAVLHIGTWADKNVETTIRAFIKLAETDPIIKLYIVGVLWEFHKNLLSKLRKEISNRIYCLGEISKIELRTLLSRVKVTSVPSIYRVPVLSPTVLESLASGTPVVGGSTAISNDLLIDGYNGFRVYPTDFMMLYDRISMITTNKELWNELSRNARFVSKKFDASIVARKYIKLHESYRK